MKACVRNVVLTALLSVYSGAQLFAQGTAFTYQGRLNASGVPATGTYDLRFTVYDSTGGATVVAGPLTGSGVPVANGLFTVSLDFGTGVFTGPARWLQIAVRTNGAVTFTNLSPRQALTPLPYAIHAGTASNVVNGAVVKSLNNLRDNVTLAAGVNVTLTPSGNTLTIASTGSNGIWSLNGGSAYYNGGNVGVGTTDPTTKLTVQTVAGQYGVEHTDGARRLSTYVSSTGGWLGTRSGDPLHFFVNDGSASMTVDTTGNIGIGTAAPSEKLEVVGNISYDKLTKLDTSEHLYATVRAHDFLLGHSARRGSPGRALVDNGADGLVLNFAGDWSRTHVNGNLNADANLGVTANLTVGGNVGIGTTTPADKLYIAGEGASGYAIGIEGNARQNRDKGGWVKAMAKVNADGSIARQFSAFGGTITGIFHTASQPYRYYITFPFQISDRFVAVTPFHNGSVGVVMANIYAYCDACDPNTVSVLIRANDVGGGLANEFFIFVY